MLSKGVVFKRFSRSPIGDIYGPLQGLLRPLKEPHKALEAFLSALQGSLKSPHKAL